MEAVYMWKAELMVDCQKEGKDSMAVRLPQSMTIGEVVESLDRFYGEPTNRIIPAFYALEWVNLKSHGASEAALRGWESNQRAWAASKTPKR